MPNTSIRLPSSPVRHRQCPLDVCHIDIPPAGFAHDM
jgi:hypothetical protein